MTIARRGLFRTLRLLLLAVLAPACGSGGSGGGPAGGTPSFGPFPGILFVADQNVDEQYELYASDWLGTQRVNLSGPLVSGGSVTSIYWSPDRAWVAFIADKETDEVFELYVVPADGSAAPVKVSGTLTAGGDVTKAEWSPDSTRLAFLADKSTNDVVELYTVAPTGGAAPVQVSGALVAGGNVTGFAWSPDSASLAYLADQVVDEQFELYSAPSTTAGGAIKVSHALAAGEDVFFRFYWTFDGSRIIYAVSALYSALPTSAGSGTQISSGSVYALTVSVNPKANQVAYRGTGSGVFITPADTSTGTIDVTALSPAAVSSTNNYLKWSPDGNLLSFYQSNGSAYDTLFVVRSNGTGKVQVGPVDGFYRSSFPYDSSVTWSADGTRLAFIDDASGLTWKGKLYVEKADGSGGGSPGGSNQDAVNGVTWSAQSNRLAYEALDLMLGANRPFTCDTVPSAPVLLDDPIVAGGYSENNPLYLPTFSTNGLRIVHRAYRDSLSHAELYSSAVDGSGTVKLSGPLVAGGNVANYIAR